MGERAVGHEATPAELAKMVTMLRDSLAEGGFVLFDDLLDAQRLDGIPSRRGMPRRRR
jgi:N-acyl-D-aspartate/D-glutamate deacylase